MATKWKWVSSSNQLKPEYWHAANPFQQDRLDECVRTAADLSLDPREAVAPLCNFIVEQIESADVTVEAAYFILHAQDAPKDDSDVDPETGCGIPHLHYHIEISDAMTPNEWSEVLGVRRNFISPVKKGANNVQRRSNSLSYFIHIKYPEKHQYDPQTVYTARGTDYMAIYRDSRAQWEMGRDVLQYESAASRDNYTKAVMDIMDGRITPDDLYNTPEGRYLAHRYGPGIDEAYRVFKKSKAQQAIRAIDQNQFTKTSMFIRGEAGSGKSWFAKLIAKALCTMSRGFSEEPWCYYLAQASTDYLDSYAMQEVVIYNDIEADLVGHMKWKHLLEPHEINAVHSRYNNVAAAARVNLITNTQDIYEYWWYQRTRSMRESIDQLLRRIELLIDVVTLSDDDKEEPDNENTRVRVRQLKKLPADDPVRFDVVMPKSGDWTQTFSSRYVYVVPEGLPEWIHPNEALEVVLKLIMENNRRPYELSSAALEGIEAARQMGESYSMLPQRMLKPRLPEPPQPKQLEPDVCEDADYEAEPVQPIDSLTLTGLSVKYSLNLSNLIGASGTPEINIFELKSYIDHFVEEELRGEPDPLRVDFNPFTHPEDLNEILFNLSQQGVL